MAKASFIWREPRKSHSYGDMNLTVRRKTQRKILTYISNPINLAPYSDNIPIN